MADHSRSGVATASPPGDLSGGDVVQHRVRTAVGLVSLSWNPGQGAFVAARGEEQWSSPRLGDLARTAGISIPAVVARELRRAEQINPAPRFRTLAADGSPPDEASDAATPPKPDEVAPLSPAAAGPSSFGARFREDAARQDLIENLGSIIQDLARGEGLHQAARRLEGVVVRLDHRLEAEDSPARDTVARAPQRTVTRPHTPSAAAVDRLDALPSRSAPPAASVAAP